MAFDEQLFIRALIDRPTDARKYGKSFEPVWLQTIELRPILAKVFDFTKKNNIPPSMTTLRKLFMDDDAKAYEVRYKDVLDNLERRQYDQSEAVHCIGEAKEVAICWSLDSLFHSSAFSQAKSELDGAEVIREIRKWYSNFDSSTDSVDLRIEDAFTQLMEDRGWKNVSKEIPTYIEFIDDWCGGGLRPKQLGIVVAPTGHGKSVVLSVMAYRMATTDKKNVLYISNELAWDEVTERFGALFTGYDLNTILKEPTVLKIGNERIQQWGVENRLYTWEVRSEISTDDMEVKLKEYSDLYGWAPDVVIVDYMERMKPTTEGYKRDATWNWYGAIASDLVRFAKRNNVLVWTAGQTNRSGMNNKNEQSMDQTQGSVRHLQEASAVISLRSRDDLNEHIQLENEHVSILEFRPLKMRHSRRAPGSLFVEADLGKMMITTKYHKAAEFAGLTEKDKEDFKGSPDEMVEQRPEHERTYYDPDAKRAPRRRKNQKV